MTTRRREVLMGGSAIAATTGSLPAPAIAQGIKELKMVTSWPENLPGSSEWIGPCPDTALGLDKAADYYHYPGFHEPGSSGTLGVNKALWDGLTTSERAQLEAAAQAEISQSLAEFNAENVKAPKLLRADPRIKILRFNDELIKTLGKLSKEVLADTAAKDPPTRKVYDSYRTCLAGVMDWGELSETGYRDTQRLALG